MAYSKMRIVAVFEVRKYRRRQWKYTDHSVICMIARYTKARLKHPINKIRIELKINDSTSE